jgi:L-threonylcarbamoyladenylate synthase
MLNRITKKKRMAAEYLKVSSENPSRKILDRAVSVLKSGGVIIYPTDTLYGFGALVNNREAIDKIYQIKKRDREKPFTILVNSRADAEKIAGGMTLNERKIFESLLPGKITLLIKARKKISIPGLEHVDKIGFRIPGSKLCRQLVRLSGSPISSSSVNISKKENLGRIEDISLEFGRKVDLILDGGKINSLKGSSVLDISIFPPVLMREGEVSKQLLEKKLGLTLRLGYSRKYVITFICSGNICRSPMAEGILRKKLDKEIFKDKVEVNSAGTLNLPASTASIESINIAGEHQVDLNNHLSRPVDRLIVDRAHLVLCMAEEHYDELTRRYPEDKHKIFMLRRFEKEGLVGDASIEDPIGRDEEFYSQIYDQIEEEIERILPFIMKRILKYVYNL